MEQTAQQQQQSADDAAYVFDRDTARIIASEEAKAGHDTGKGSLAAQVARAVHINETGPAHAPPAVPVLSPEEAAQVVSAETRAGHDTGKGSYAAQVQSAALKAAHWGHEKKHPTLPEVQEGR